MSADLERLDKEVSHLLATVRLDPSRRSSGQNELYVLLRGIVVAHVLRELEQPYQGVPIQERDDEVCTQFAYLLFKACDHLGGVGWQIGDGFGIANPKKVKDPSHLRRCLTTAVAREARKRCAIWMKEHRGDSDAVDNQVCVSPSVQAMLEREETAEALYEALALLPAQLREPFIYHCALDWTLRVVARILGTNHVQVLRRVKEAEAFVRKHLEGHS